MTTAGRRLRRDAVGRIVLDVPAEAIPLQDGSVDAVLATAVLCSVRSPERTVEEACRVLAAGAFHELHVEWFELAPRPVVTGPPIAGYGLR